MTGTDTDWYARHAARLSFEYGKVDSADMHRWLSATSGNTEVGLGGGTSTDITGAGVIRTVTNTGLLGLGHDAVLLLRTPSPTAIRSDKKLHPARP